MTQVLRFTTPPGLFLLTLLAIAAASLAQEPNVRGYVQGMVDAAQPGDVVDVIGGLYPENVRIAKPLTLRGLEYVIIDGGVGKALRIEGAAVRIENINLRSTGAPLEISNSSSVELMFVEVETGGPPTIRDSGWVRHLTPPKYDPTPPQLSNASYIHSHPLTVRLLDDAGRPRADARVEVYDGSQMAFTGSTDAKGYVHDLPVAHAWATASGAGQNQTRLHAVEEDTTYPLDPHAGTQTLGGGAAGTWPVNPVAVAPSAVALGAAAGLLAFRFYEPFRWRWLLLLAPLYTRFAKGQILEHGVRETIFGYVEQNPGAHLRGIRRDLGLQNGTLIHHLQMLEQHGFLKSARDGMYRRYFVLGAAPRFEGADETADQVLRWIQERPGTTNLAIAQGLGKRPSLVHYHVQRLEEQGRIRKDRVGRETHLYYVPGSGRPAS